MRGKAGMLWHDGSLQRIYRERGEKHDIERGGRNTEKRCRVYNIGFDVFDETQFTAYGIRDLEECWEGFCEDEGLEKDCVDYVEEAPKG